jgi:hypothetical protein
MKIWHDEMQRLEIWGTLDPPDACMCADCVLTPQQLKEISMSENENPQNDVQDPSEPYEVDTAVETHNIQEAVDAEDAEYRDPAEAAQETPQENNPPAPVDGSNVPDANDFVDGSDNA